MYILQMVRFQKEVTQTKINVDQRFSQVNSPVSKIPRDVFQSQTYFHNNSKIPSALSNVITLKRVSFSEIT